jgi:UDP-N-acetylmuramoyl-tripeptide--D-alanyl-D-alanine ligase
MLFKGLGEGSVKSFPKAAVVNLDDPFVVREAQEFTGARLGFGFGPEAAVRASAVGFGGLRGARFTLTTPQGSARVGFGLLGRHNVANALAAAAAGSALGIGAEETARALEGFSPFPGRLEPRRLESGIYLIDDTYNANPASMTAALNVLASLRHPRGRLAAVLGDMLELGAASRSEHEGVGRLAGGLGLDLLVTVGSESKALDKASTQGKRPPVKRAWFPDAAEAAQWLEKRVTARDRILVKGSRGMKMERVVRKLAHGEEG